MFNGFPVNIQTNNDNVYKRINVKKTIRAFCALIGLKYDELSFTDINEYEY